MSDISFHRTGVGISNYYLFLNTQEVYFCEGQDPAVGDDLECEPLDQVFWSDIITNRLKKHDFKIVPCGSKTQVIERVKLAAEADYRAHDRPRIFGCVDRDYDDPLMDITYNGLEGRIWLTDGYSVESDLLNAVGYQEAVRVVAPRLSAAARDKIEGSIKRLDLVLGRIRYIDSLFRSKGLEFLPTEGIPAFIQKVERANQPLCYSWRQGLSSFVLEKLQRHGLKKLRSIKNLQTKKIVYSTSLERGLLFCPGKMIIKSFCLYLNALGRKINGWASLHWARFQETLIGLLRGSNSVDLINYKGTLAWSWAVT